MEEALIVGRYLYWEQWVLVGVVLTVTLLLWKTLWVSRGSRKNQHIPLPLGSTGWPLIGESISFYRGLRSAQPRQIIQDHEKKYGPVFRTNLFGRKRMVVSVDPEFNRYVLQNEGRLFQANYPQSFRNLVGKYGLVNVHGDLQKKLHAVAANLLKQDNLISDFMDDIQNFLLADMQRWQHKGVIHLQEECNKVLLKIMGKKLLDLSPSEETEEIYKAFEAYVLAIISIPIKFPGSSYARGIKGRETIKRKIEECIQERRQNPQVIRNDFLTKLLKEESWPDEIIIDLLLFIMFAGYETSSTSMAFAIKFLTNNPRALEELRVEHDSLLKDNGNRKLTWDDYQAMKFTHCVIKETLRLGNAGLGAYREAKQDIKFKDFVIPKEWTVLVLLFGTHLDEKYYPEPFTFNPWRWQNESPLALSDNPWFMPFGRGARLCPGFHLARFEIALFLHNFVTKFRWEPIGDDQICYFPAPTLVNHLLIRLYDR
ncbi:hypothetical protein SUGI_0306620 [Cryptomeria japonica]|uniref:cytochrome P450 720B2 n=1 Tax=Cryptomeria japonica TaxID=3369 RepID=UPI002408B7F1|nr:cytochrome P450 720B2 [Cryptomeria japonica]GLJ17608.1 hypothetical protein SUGI_0306620 [Cryptomeria japonica]